MQPYTALLANSFLLDGWESTSTGGRNCRKVTCRSAVAVLSLRAESWCLRMREVKRMWGFDDQGATPLYP